MARKTNRQRTPKARDASDRRRSPAGGRPRRWHLAGWLMAGLGMAALIALLVWGPWRRPVDLPEAGGGGESPRAEDASGELPTVAAGGNDSPPHDSSPLKVVEERSAGNRTDGRPQLITPRITAARAQQQEGLDPQRDGWPTEALAELAAAQLKQLLQGVGNAPQVDPAEWGGILAEDFACAPLRPLRLERTYRDDTVAVQRGSLASLRSASPLRGMRGLNKSLLALHAALGKPDIVDAEAKIYAVQMQDALMAAKARVELNARPPAQRAQIRADWDCLWSVQDGQVLLSTIRVADYEEVVARYAAADWFSDATTAVLGHNAAWPSQLMLGLDDWLQRVERVHRMHVFMSCGLAVGDANGDQRDDLYVCQPGGLPNRLFLQNLDGTATDVSMRARVDWLDSTSSALFVDLDNDGDQDLVLATLSGLVIHENDGAARFRLVGTLPTEGSDPQSLSAVDYDNDGDLDLYVCLNFPKMTSAAEDRADTFVYHDANDGAANHLFRNNWLPNHDWVFSDVTRSSGLDVDNRRHSLAAAWEDYDNDGDQDLYVANDYGQNCLYRNEGAQFVNVAPQAGVVDFGSGMSVSWSDYDRDGQMDLYVGNMFSSAGSRVTAQPQFRPGIDGRIRSILRRFAKGNSLFHNDGKGGFQDVGAAAHVERARWAWSSLFADLNNSGWEDIVVANGYITTDDTGDL